MERVFDSPAETRSHAHAIITGGEKKYLRVRAFLSKIDESLAAFYEAAVDIEQVDCQLRNGTNEITYYVPGCHR